MAQKIIFREALDIEELFEKVETDNRRLKALIGSGFGRARYALPVAPFPTSPRVPGRPFEGPATYGHLFNGEVPVTHPPS
jgi:hypothetical protein